MSRRYLDSSARSSFRVAAVTMVGTAVGMKPVVTPPDSPRHQPPAGTSTEPKELLLGKDGGATSDPRSQPDLKAREPHIDIAEVIGSIPIAPTTSISNTNQPVPVVRRLPSEKPRMLLSEGVCVPGIRVDALRPLA